MVIRGKFPGSAAGRLWGAERLTLQFGADSRPIRAIRLSSTLSDSGFEADFAFARAALSLCPDRRARLSRAVFHIFNFPDFLSSGNGSRDLRYKTKRRMSRLGRVVLSHDPWEIEIQAHPKTAALVKQLNAEGGHAITHIGLLKRSDGRSFTIAAAERAIYDLYRFLSFARGQWTQVFGIAGFNVRDELVYQGWQQRISSPWGGPFSWFDANNGTTLVQAYDGFVRLVRDAKLGEAVDAALYWYLRSNRGGDSEGVDGGVILSQAALERLSVAVLNKNGLPTNGYASERIYQALELCQIPSAVPTALSRLSANWTDGPLAITKVRNELVHPKERLPDKPGAYAFEAWQLAQWFVEMFVLRLAAYDGVYGNRLRLNRWVGQIEPVPWAQSRRSSR